MKKILIVDKELHELKENNRVVIKKGKTIIKDFCYFKKSFINELKRKGISYSWFLEEWEVFTDEKIQVLCANDGSPLRPVHIVSSTNPHNGAIALFQSEKIIKLLIQNNTFELSKNFIVDDEDKIEIIKVGLFDKFIDIKNQLPSEYIPMINSILKNKDEYKNAYLSPFWFKIE